MRTLVFLCLLLIALPGFSAPDTLYYLTHMGGINAAYLRSSYAYNPNPDPVSGEVKTEEEWLASLNAWLSTMQPVSVDNADAVVKELMRCPNSRSGKPRYAVVAGVITPTADVLDIVIPAGFSGINPDGTLIP